MRQWIVLGSLDVSSHTGSSFMSTSCSPLPSASTGVRVTTHVFKMAQGEYKGKTIIMCLSGRGDKDVNTVQLRRLLPFQQE